VRDFLAGALTVQPAGVADDLEDLADAGELDPGRWDHAESAFFAAGVTTAELAGACRLGVVTQPVDDGGAQPRLVAFDGQHT
jgi:hypothetical protein